MITSASAAASASDSTRSPASSALRLARAALAQRHPDVDAGLAQVLRVRVPLRAVAQDRHLAAGDQRGVGIGFVVHRGHVVLLFLSVVLGRSVGRLSGVPA